MFPYNVNVVFFYSVVMYGYSANLRHQFRLLVCQTDCCPFLKLCETGWLSGFARGLPSLPPSLPLSPPSLPPSFPPNSVATTCTGKMSSLWIETMCNHARMASLYCLTIVYSRHLPLVVYLIISESNFGFTCMPSPPLSYPGLRP